MYMYVDLSLGAPTHVDLSLGAAGCMILVRSSTILVQERGRVAVTNQRDVHEQKSERPPTPTDWKGLLRSHLWCIYARILDRETFG